MRIDEIAAWIAAHQAELIAAAGALWTLVSIVVKLTPSTKDDALLHRIAQRVSALKSANVPGLLKLPGAPMDRPADPKAATLLATILALIAGLLSSGCGASGLEITRDIAAGGALGATAADPIVADRYDSVTAQCDAGQISADECTIRLRRLDRADRALRSFADSMVTVDLALDAYEDGRECGLRPALEGAARAAREAVAALDAAGLDVPPLVTGVLQIAEVMLDAPECEPDEGDVADLHHQLLLAGFRDESGRSAADATRFITGPGSAP